MRKVWITQNVRDKHNSQLSFCSVDENIWVNIVEKIIEGSCIDRTTAKLNTKFINAITGKNLQKKLATMSSILHSAPTIDIEKIEAIITTTNKECTVEYMQSQNIPFFVPFNFLHFDSQVKASNDQQVDIHEHIIFQMLHCWDCMSKSDRVTMLHGLLSKRAKKAENMADYLILAVMDKIELVMMLFAARGKFLMFCDKYLSHGSDQCDSTEGIDNNNYMIKIYKDAYSCFDETVLKKKEYNLDRDQVKRLLNPGYLQSVLVHIIYLVWESIKIHKVSDIKCDVKLNIKHDSAKIFFEDKQKKNGSLECNHAKLCERVIQMHHFFSSYGSASTLTNAERKEVLYVNFDDNYLALLPVTDKVVNARFESLYSILQMSESKQFVKKMNTLINRHFSTCPAHDSIEYRIRWVCFEMMYNRFVNVNPQLMDHEKYGKLPDDVRNRTKFTMTFGMRVLDDTVWMKNESKAEVFLTELKELHVVFQKSIIDDICNDFNDNDNKKAKKQKQQQQRNTIKTNEILEKISSVVIEDDKDEFAMLIYESTYAYQSDENIE